MILAEQIVELYTKEHLTVSEIAERVGRNRSRVYFYLRQAGIELRDDRLKSNRTRPTHCWRNLHEFTPENTRIDRNGGWHCRQCERDYALIRYYSKGDS